MNECELEVITGDQILQWHGSDHTISELAEYLAEILNGDIDVEDARLDILSYEFN